MSNIFANMCTYKGLLPQGAVTSPYITNILLKNFDEEMYDYCINRNINYTRYSDDIILSCDRKTPLKEAKYFIIDKVKGYHFLEINSRKSFKIYGKDTSKIVTGLLVNNDNVRVTRKYKRFLRAQIFNEIKVNKKSPSLEIYGKLAFIKHVDFNTFIQMTKYIKKLGIKDKFKVSFLEE
ncbi:MAG: hypothetical protein KZY61_12215 [Clostridiaceae bacterium]|nr:hypothetical protein [Clostridiaceae bacterium]MBW4869392.1 hypothetical protein [Clostridiaceae bacterium]